VAVPQPVTALIRSGRADETLLRERGRRDAGDRCPARVHPLRPGAVREELEAAGTDRQGDTLRHRELLVAGTEQLAGDDGAAEGADHASRVKPDLMPLAAGDGAEPARDLRSE